MKQSTAIRLGGGVFAAALAIGGITLFSQKAACVEAVSKVSGSYTEVVQGYDWGPGVSKLIIKLNRSIAAKKGADLAQGAFAVETTKQTTASDGSITTTTEDRTVKAAYTSDENGKKKKGSSNYLTLELACDPAVGNPFYYSPLTSFNDWSNPYTNRIRLKKGLSIKGGTIKARDFSIRTKPAKKILVGVDDTFSKGKSYSSNGQTLKYTSYPAAKTSKKKGVVVWLHGSGEGGTNVQIPLYGNKVTNLAGSSIQKDLNGCDILVVQCPTRWLSYKTGITTPDEENPLEKYQSPYTDTLKALIEKYVSKNNISPNRIYIGGASNGGSMTMNMLLNYPDYFSAAFFASEGYADRYITDEQIESIKGIPMWFVYAEGDQTNDPLKTTKATYDRLMAAGAPNTHLSYYAEGVVDKSGKYKDDDGSPHRYSAHWSWVYLLNNDCREGSVKLFKWLGKL